MIHHFLYTNIQRLKLKVQPAPHATRACHPWGQHDTDASPRAPQARKSRKEEGPPHRLPAMPYPCGGRANSKLWPRSSIQGKGGGRTRPPDRLQATPRSQGAPPLTHSQQSESLEPRVASQSRALKSPACPCPGGHPPSSARSAATPAATPQPWPTAQRGDSRDREETPAGPRTSGQSSEWLHQATERQCGRDPSRRK